MERTDRGRFTACGGPGVERLLGELADGVAERCREVAPPAELRALVLLGGYGRGEGGVLKDGSVERPHNNLDLLLITGPCGPAERAALEERLALAAAPLARSSGVQLDLACIPEANLRRSPCLVMWYDMRFGHKTLAGDAGLVPSLDHLRVECVPAWDVRNLLVNRGTLLLINEQLLASRPPSPADRDLVVKHAMKAVIGYGDALLFARNAYHWSYAEKQRRMRACAGVPEALRRLYDRAVEFRFRPDYHAWRGVDLTAWSGELRSALAEAHLAFEAWHLDRPGLEWGAYAEPALRQALFAEPLSARAWARKLRNALAWRPGDTGSLSTGARLGLRALGPRGALAVMFPVPAYHLDDLALAGLAASCLQARGTDLAELRRAYLARWTALVDTHAGPVLRRFSIDLEPAGGAP